MYSSRAGTVHTLGTKFYNQYKPLVTKLDLGVKVKVNPNSSFKNNSGPKSLNLPGIKVIGILVLDKKMFKFFYHILAWRPYRSCEPDKLNNIPPQDP